MKIVVCVKQVLDTAAKINIQGGKVDPSGIPRIINPYDEFAIEEAIRIKEKIEGVEITVVSLGPETSKEVLRSALAMGADNAIHLLDSEFEKLDNLGVARALALAIKSISFDLILCGRQAVDDDMGQIGGALATILGLPLATVVTKLDFSDDGSKAIATRQIEGGSETFELALPALLTCQKGLNEPRLPSLKGIMKAKKKEVKIIDSSALEWDEFPKPRVLQGDASLPLKRSGGSILEGSPSEKVAKLVQLLRDEAKVV